MALLGLDLHPEMHRVRRKVSVRAEERAFQVEGSLAALEHWIKDQGEAVR